ncbi:MAG: LamG domain-containing protein [Candidatus Cloacimonetes bacterium]|nr:LamG domain-containing protein [Candidatus Cloacimonadota bacterium]
MNKIKIDSGNGKILMDDTYHPYLEPNLFTNLITVYELDETSGTTASDETSTNSGSINASHVTINQTGKIDKCYWLWGTLGGITSTYNGFSSTTSDFSFNTWINRGSSYEPSDRGIFVVPTDEGNIGLWTFASGSLYGSVLGDTFNESYSFSASTWYMVTMTIGDTIRLYVNGSQLGSDITRTNTNAYTGNANVRIGYLQTGNWNPYLGYMDQTCFWNRALTQDDIDKLYNAGSGLAYSNWTV